MKKSIICRIWAAAMCTAVLAGCSKEESAAPGAKAVQFATSITRASGTSWAADDQIGIWMTDHSSAAVVGSAANIPHVTADGTGSFSPVVAADKIFFPQTGAVDFLAYYPYSAGAAGGTYAIDVAAQAAPEDIDLLWAKATNGGSGYNKAHVGAVALQFEHKLALFTMNVKHGAGVAAADLANMTVAIAGMKVTAPFDIPAGTVGAATGNATAITPVKLAAPTGGYTATYQAIVLPVSYPANTVKVTFTLAAGTPNAGPYTWTLPAKEFTPGDNHIYEVTIARAGVSFTGSITDWNTGNSSASTLIPETQWDGKSVSEPDDWNGGAPLNDPIRIYTAAELAWVSMMTNRTDGSKTDFAGKNLRLMNDLDLGGFQWTPIGDESGTNYVFKGNFDGGGHKISNLFINTNTSIEGLFGKIASGGTVKNLHIASGSVKGSANIGGLCGRNEGLIEGCSNAAKVSGGKYVGGVCGLTWGNTTACYNTGTVSGIIYIGGVNGLTRGNTTACYNTGMVSGTTDYVGGVCGESYGTFTACDNTGAVSGGSYIGGVTGDSWKIEYCDNTGAVSGVSYVGGVCGRSYSGGYTERYDASIVYCSNFGTVSGTDHVGGVCGQNYSETQIAYIIYCSNFGTVSATGGFAGGLCGENTKGTITACYNTGEVSATGNSNDIGGVTGYNFGTITACYNTGEVGVTGNSNNIGGVTGFNIGTITACYNTAKVSGSGTGNAVGYLCGLHFIGSITACYALGGYSGPGVAIFWIGQGGNTGVTPFGIGAPPTWPGDSMTGWGIGNNYAAGQYWKTLGGWAAGGNPSGINSNFPKLHFEQ